MIKYKQEFDLAQSVALEVGGMLRKQTHKDIISQENRDIKLELDKKAEEEILNKLKASSEHSILSEESGTFGELNESDPLWIVDPIDGSMNYSRDCPFACVSIALWKGNEPIIGVVYDFYRDELFTGLVGVGSWLNTKPIHPSGIVEKKRAILATGFPTYLDINEDNLGEFIEDVKKYKKIRMFGSAALSLCYVANGRVDSYKEKNIKLWDIAAGVAINKALNINIEIKRTHDFNTYTFVGV